MKKLILLPLILVLILGFLVLGGCSDNGGSGFEMVSITGGSFQMGDISGDGEANERPVHTVTLSSFLMANYEVTYAKWMEVKDWAEVIGYTFRNSGAMGSEDFGGTQDENHPVMMIDWYDAVLWCNALSEIEGLTPCYYTSTSQITVYRSGELDIKEGWVNWEANGYRLPTEAEWEYACRAGNSTKYSFGNTLDGHDANFNLSGDGYEDNPPYYGGTTPVGDYSANDYGLYDMHGNVKEWCFDWYHKEYYKASTDINPHGPLVGSKEFAPSFNYYLPPQRVVRGGFTHSNPPDLRSASRDHELPFGEIGAIGFRPVRSN